ncbi:MAG: aminotransferase class III-fold pyridoxal phosphate-dependent enzyme, partial [Oscillospiraceae bacterium]
LNSMLDGTVCAVILEIIQGEGGVIETPLSYIEYVKQQCDENDILLIFDEVQTGVGRTGKLFAYENINIKPDILTAAKGLGGGLPIGACLCSEQLKDVLTAGTHGTTFGGNPVVLAGAIEVLNRIDDAFLNEVNKKGEYIKEKLQTIDEISEVRGMGLMIGIDLKEKSATDIAKKAVQNGLLILTAKQSLRMLPPLTITYDEIDEGLEILKKIL